MNWKIIKNEEDYSKAIDALEKLVCIDSPSPKQLEELELATFLVEKYEQENHPIPLPDPIEAIKFRMEQEGLTRKDLAKYIGSASKVSEVLSGKKPLSLAMMRALYEGLGIPAEVLLQEVGKDFPQAVHTMNEYPFLEMFRRGYFEKFKGTLKEAKERSEELLSEFFGGNVTPSFVFCRQKTGSVNANAMNAWYRRVCKRAEEKELPEYISARITKEFCEKVGLLSYYDHGFELAIELLEKNGIAVIFEKHLPKTYLDGAAFFTPTGRPVIALSLRYSRMDNLWFTLLHELGHVCLHLQKEDSCFVDDVTAVDMLEESEVEREADVLAENSLIPQKLWERYKVKLLNMQSLDEVALFAAETQLDRSVLIGRIHKETNNYKLFPGGIRNISDRQKDRLLQGEAC